MSDGRSDGLPGCGGGEDRGIIISDHGTPVGHTKPETTNAATSSATTSPPGDQREELRSHGNDHTEPDPDLQTG